MAPRELQQQIHVTFSPMGGVWSGFHAQIVAFDRTPENFSEFGNHLLREFNRKVYKLGFPNLAFDPHDSGYRFIGPSLGGEYIDVYTIGDQQVLMNNSEPVQVPESYANS